MLTAAVATFCSQCQLHSALNHCEIHADGCMIRCVCSEEEDSEHNSVSITSVQHHLDKATLSKEPVLLLTRTSGTFTAMVPQRTTLTST